MIPSRETCPAAVRSRDARFDGVFCTAVRTTGIYCRPSCPARAPREQNIGFYASAAAAQHEGFRACKRCRPDAVPGSPEWDARADVVARAMRLVGDGVIDREGVSGLAARVGYSPRQVERLIRAELGATPVALARSQRAHTARLLLETTAMPLSQVAYAAGFGSLRSFNETMAAVYATTPRELRRHGPRGSAPLGAVRVRLPFRAPFEPSNVFGHLVATAVPGVEEWRDGAYRRTLTLPHGPGIIGLRWAGDHVAAQVRLCDPRDLTPAITRCRRLLDLDADPVAVDDHLRADPVLRPLVDGAPGRRVPRAVDGGEFALRAVIGQQVSTASARTHAARIVAAAGVPIEDPDGGLTHLFPTPEAVAELGPAALTGPAARAATLHRLSTALADGDLDLTPGADWTQARARLGALPGIGPWTVEMIAMRALGDPDAFPATDLGVRRGCAALGVSPPLTTAAAQAWRPWRSYAVQYLWAMNDHPINRYPEDP